MRIISLLFNFKRKTRIMNPEFDPTEVVTWKAKWRKLLDIELTGIWEVECRVYWRNRCIIYSYDAKWSNRLFEILEDEYWQDREEDGEDIRRAERLAGWDPNP